MCFNCGCKIYDDDMGDAKNLTTKDVEEMAKLNNMSVEDTLKEIHEATAKLLAKAGHDHPDHPDHDHS